MFVSAVIVAAGKGLRLKSSTPKQFLELQGKPILAHAIESFAQAKVDEIVLVLGDVSDFSQIKNSISIQPIITPGGSNRQASVYLGLLRVSKNADIVLIHDGVRPFVTSDDVNYIIHQAAEKGNCIYAVRQNETIKVCDETGVITSTPNRAALWVAQTPQAFDYKTIMLAHQQAEADGFLGTDDAQLVERLGRRVFVIEGSYKNIKITTEEDLARARSTMN